MKQNFEKALAQILKSEGGFVNHPADPGGMTNLGVTKKVWEAFVGHPVDEAQMRALTPATVAPLYKREYWDKVKGDDLPSGIDYLVFDAAVNMGTSRAIKLLQQSVGATVDGAIGPGTLGAVAKADAKHILKTYSDVKTVFYKSLASFPTFGKGWLNRVAEVENHATTMIA